MQGSNGHYGHYGGRSAPTQRPNMIFSLSNDMPGSAPAHNPQPQPQPQHPPLHYQSSSSSSLPDPLLYPHHRAQQVAFNQHSQLARRQQQATMAQWQVAAAAGFEDPASMRQTGFEHAHPFQSQMMALRKGPGFDSDPAPPPPQFAHRQLGPESDNTRQELSSQQQQRHLGIELGYQTLSSQMQPQKSQQQQRSLGFDPNSYQTTTPQLGFEPPTSEDENACQQARAVHQQLGFESDSPESSSSDDGPPSPTPQPPPSLNPVPPPAAQDVNKQAENNDNDNDEDENDNDNDNDHDVAAVAAHNRWPKKETMALLKARAEMDALFRDIGPKWPLWEEISRKLAEIGCKRSAKKCKEKFENVLKYYKKTKEGKAMRPERKNYRFFNQLEAIFGSGSSAFMGVGGGNTPTPILTPAAAVRGINKSMIMQGINNNQLCGSSVGGMVTGRLLMDETGGANKPSETEDCSSPFNFSSESSGDDEDGEGEDRSGGEGGQEKKRKRKSSSTKVLRFFEHLMKKVTQKQDQLHQKLLQALERRESDRMHREQAWRRQEMARLGQELELRSQERALASTRDAALVSFLQQATGRSFEGIVAPTPISTSSPLRVNPITSDEPLLNNTTTTPSLLDPKNKRWPKPEVLALIKFRSALEPKFQDPGPKGRIWKQVSREMASLGFTRSARRCREKWENINKYFLRTRESNKKRSENSKTCPYFSQLDALYRKGVLGCPPPPPQKATAATAAEKSSQDVNLATEANATAGDDNANSNAVDFPNPNNNSGIGA